MADAIPAMSEAPKAEVKEMIHDTAPPNHITPKVYKVSETCTREDH